MAKLSKKHELFVREYLTDLNQTRAYIAAGYSKQGAAQSASKLLKNPKIQAEVAKRTEKRLAKLDVTADNVINELAKMGFSNMADYVVFGDDGSARVDFSKVSREQAAAMQEITVDEYSERTGEDPDGKPTFETVKRVRFKLGDKRGSLELLGKYLKLFTDKVEHGGGMQMIVRHSIPQPAR